MLKTKEEYLEYTTSLCKRNWLEYRDGIISHDTYCDRRMIYLAALHEACAEFTPGEQQELWRINQSQPWTKEY